MAPACVEGATAGDAELRKISGDRLIIVLCLHAVLLLPDRGVASDRVPCLSTTYGSIHKHRLCNPSPPSGMSSLRS